MTFQLAKELKCKNQASLMDNFVHLQLFMELNLKKNIYISPQDYRGRNFTENFTGLLECSTNRKINLVYRRICRKRFY